MSDTATMNDLLEAFFRARPNLLIDGKVLAQVCGGYGWRTRVSDLRKYRGMTIENVQQRFKRDGKVWTISEYRFVPSSPAEEWEPVQVGDAVQVGLL